MNDSTISRRTYDKVYVTLDEWSQQKIFNVPSIRKGIANELADIFRQDKTIRDFRVQCDRGNNSMEVIFSNTINVDIFVQKSVAVSFVHIDLKVTGSGTVSLSG